MCIVDEAGQITLPAVLGAVLRAHQFALVGDHHQLPPLVQNPAAAEQGLDCSLFRRLCEAHPQVHPLARTLLLVALCGPFCKWHKLPDKLLIGLRADTLRDEYNCPVWVCNVCLYIPMAAQAVVTLRTQYRMCADIMAIANELTYDGQLRCGSPLVEQGMLAQTAPIPESLPDWLRQASP